MKHYPELHFEPGDRAGRARINEVNGHVTVKHTAAVDSSANFFTSLGEAIAWFEAGLAALRALRPERPKVRADQLRPGMIVELDDDEWIVAQASKSFRPDLVFLRLDHRHDADTPFLRTLPADELVAADDPIAWPEDLPANEIQEVAS